jgi:hypothetical protein
MNRELMSRGVKSVCLLALLFLLPACSRPKTAAESSHENRSGPIVQKDIFHQEKTIVVPPTKSCDV